MGRRALFNFFRCLIFFPLFDFSLHVAADGVSPLKVRVSDLERQEPQRQHERCHHQPKANPGFNQFGAVVQIVEHAHGPEKRPDLCANGIACLVDRFAASAARQGLASSRLMMGYEGRAASVIACAETSSNSPEAQHSPSHRP